MERSATVDVVREVGKAPPAAGLSRRFRGLYFHRLSHRPLFPQQESRSLREGRSSRAFVSEVPRITSSGGHWCGDRLNYGRNEAKLRALVDARPAGPDPCVLMLVTGWGDERWMRLRLPRFSWD